MNNINGSAEFCVRVEVKDWVFITYYPNAYCLPWGGCAKLLKSGTCKSMWYKTPNAIYLLLDILFLSNHNIHKSLCGLCFWASDHLIDRSYWIFQLRGLKLKNKVFMNVVFWRKIISNTHMSSIRMNGKLSDTLNILYINIKIYNEKICCHAIHTCRIIIKKSFIFDSKNSSRNR